MTRPEHLPRQGPAPGPATATADPLSGRLALRLDEVADALGVSRSTIERERRAGRFPPPDLKIGRMPLWKPETIRALVDKGGGR